MAKKETRKAVELETKDELKQSAIERYLPKLQELKASISKANAEKVKAFVETGKILTDLKPHFQNNDELFAWAKENVGLEKAQIKNMMQAGKPENKEHVENAIVDSLSPTDMMKTIRNGGKGSKPAEKPAPAFDYGVKRNASEFAKPGEGTTEEIADQLYEAVRSVIVGTDNEGAVIEAMLELLESHVIEPKQEENVS